MKRFSLILIFFGLFLAGSTRAENSPDAVAFRVLPNPKHYSALHWYDDQGFKGSPQLLIVDGYQAIRDGRTVYVNIANVDLNTNKYFTNIFVVSYNQNAENNTLDIFGQILSNLKFNTNLNSSGTCIKAGTGCLADSDCPTGDFCNSLKARTARDTRRLEGMYDLNQALNAYKANNNRCPNLSAGSYLPNTSISTWPSWQATLGSKLGIDMPMDPINQLGDCSQEIKKNGKQYSFVAVLGCLYESATFTGRCSNDTWEYTFNINKAANYDVDVETSNSGAYSSYYYGDISKFNLPFAENVCPAAGIQHHILISVDGVDKGSLCNDAVPIDYPHVTGELSLGYLSQGSHTVKLTWDNDWTYLSPENHYADSNIIIHSVSLKSRLFNQTTCWNDVDKTFADPTPSDNNFNLPSSSLAYVYTSSSDQKQCSIYGIMESGLDCPDVGACTGSQYSNANINDSTVNHPPVISCGTLNGITQQAFLGFVSGTDPDGDPLTWSALDTSATSNNGWPSWSSAPTIRNSSIPDQREIYAAKSGNPGTYTFNVTATDTSGSSVSKQCSIKITSPQFLIDSIADKSVSIGHDLNSFTVAASESANYYPLSFNFKGVNGGTVINDILTCGATSPTTGEVNGSFKCFTAGKKIEYSPGTYTVTLSVTDNANNVKSTDFKLIVNNDPPAVSVLNNNLLWTASSTLPISVNLFKVNDDPLNYPLTASVANGPLLAGLSGSLALNLQDYIYSVGGSLNATNVFDAQQKDYTYNMRFSDKYNSVGQASFTTAVRNSPPIINHLNCPSVVRINNPYTCSVSAADAEGNVIRSYSMTGFPAGLTIAKQDGCQGTVGCWHLRNDYNDYSGNGYNGTPQNGVSLVSTTGTNAAAFVSASDSRVNVGNKSGLVMSNQVSIVANIYPTGPGSSGTYGGIIVNKEGEYEVTRYPDGSINWAFKNLPLDSYNPVWQFHNSGYIAPLNKWTTIAVVFGNNAVKTYANGTLVNTVNFVGSNAIGDYNSTLNDFWIGARQAGGQSFDGQINEVRVYNHVISDAEIASPVNANEAIILGSPTVANTFNVSVNATDEFGYTGVPETYSLTVNTYCGDGNVQNPNGEGVAESCDGINGIATSTGASSAAKQYACSAGCGLTGGYCGDGFIQSGYGETCDDKNKNSIDGCDSSCHLEANWTCSGTPTVCVPNSQTVACTAKPANSVWNTSGTVLQTWSGTAWLPSNVSSHDTNPGICKYVCASGFHQSGSSCVPDVCGDGVCNASESYASCHSDCTPYCTDGSTPVIPAGKTEYYCRKNAYTWAKQLDNTCYIHFHSDGTITYTNEGFHGALSTNSAYAYPFSFDPNLMFPVPSGGYYDLNVSGSSCQLNTTPTTNSSEVMIPILEPSGGEHVCTAVIQLNIPAN